MSISKRLLLLIASAVLGLSLVAGMGIYQIGKVYTAANLNTVNGMPSLVDLNKAMFAVSQLRLDPWKYITNDDAANTKKIDAGVLAHQKAFEDVSSHA